jgi:hypothetical protein
MSSDSTITYIRAVHRETRHEIRACACACATSTCSSALCANQLLVLQCPAVDIGSPPPSAQPRASGAADVCACFADKSAPCLLCACSIGCDACAGRLTAGLGVDSAMSPAEVKRVMWAANLLLKVCALSGTSALSADGCVKLCLERARVVPAFSCGQHIAPYLNEHHRVTKSQQAPRSINHGENIMISYVRRTRAVCQCCCRRDALHHWQRHLPGKVIPESTAAIRWGLSCIAYCVQRILFTPSQCPYRKVYHS